jgi:16S rRNA (guanine527-N7)-methyltransferase
MPSESAAGPGPGPLPASLEADRRAFLAALKTTVEGLQAGDPRQGWLRDSRALALWDRHVAIVHGYSERLAIVARGDRGRLYSRHVLDSLNPLGLFDAPPASMLDIGSGGGFPGIPLAIAWPQTRVTLLESREKKVGFLEMVVRELALSNARAVCARLEEYGEGRRTEERFAAIAIRAVGGLPDLLRRARPICAPGATWIYFVGSGDRGESLGRELEPAGFAAELRAGLFGGVLLTGRLPGA